MVHAFDVIKAHGEMPAAAAPGGVLGSRGSRATSYSSACFASACISRSCATTPAQTIGLVTLEDLLEELVGDIRDEHDEPEPPRTARNDRADRRYDRHAKLLADFDAGQKAALARAVSIVENHRAGFDQLLARMQTRIGRARRIGITGPPGAGKSTLTTQLARAYRDAGLTVGIVAVDPTSPFTGGALLGDRIRMEVVALDPGVFIRSMATRGSLGGLAAATREVARRARRVRHRQNPHRDGRRRTE